MAREAAFVVRKRERVESTRSPGGRWGRWQTIARHYERIEAEGHAAHVHRLDGARDVGVFFNGKRVA